MTEEPTMKVVVDKKQMVHDLAHLRQLTTEYDRLLHGEGAGGEWEGEALALVRFHHEALHQANVSLRTIDLVSALMREMLQKIDVEQLTLRVNTTPSTLRVAPKGEVGEEALDHLIGQINILAQNVPMAMQEKIRLLLISARTFFKNLMEKDREGVSDAMMQINMLSSNRESQNLVREIALIARNIYNTLNTLSEGIALDSLAGSTDGISEAARKLKGVVSKLEEAAFHNLDQLEELGRRAKEDEEVCDRVLMGLRSTQQGLGELKGAHPEHAAALTEIQELLGDDLGAGAMDLKTKFRENAKVFLSLIGNQSFQDLTGQTLKKTIEFIETLELQLVELLQKYRPVLGLGMPPKARAGGASTEAPESKQQNQDQVDALLADLGF